MKTTITRVVVALLALYLLLSAAASAAYRFLPPALAGEVARHRNGLLIVDIDERGIWVLSPFDNYIDSWL